MHGSRGEAAADREADPLRGVGRRRLDDRAVVAPVRVAKGDVSPVLLVTLQVAARAVDEEPSRLRELRPLRGHPELRSE